MFLSSPEVYACSFLRYRFLIVHFYFGDIVYYLIGLYMFASTPSVSYCSFLIRKPRVYFRVFIFVCFSPVSSSIQSVIYLFYHSKTRGELATAYFQVFTSNAFTCSLLLLRFACFYFQTTFWDALLLWMFHFLFCTA